MTVARDRIWKFGLGAMLVMISAVSAHGQAPQWADQTMTGDWIGHDLGCRESRAGASLKPLDELCTSEKLGNVAVCLKDEVNGYPGVDPGCSDVGPDHHKAKDWCNYKQDVDITQPDGPKPGKVYLCRTEIRSAIPPAPLTEEVIIVPHEFRASEQGSFFLKSIREMDSPEFVAIMSAACLAYGVDCSKAAETMRQAAHYATPLISQGDLQTTAWIDRHPGEEYYAKFAAPDGYSTCKAKIDIRNGSITGPSTFNGGIQRMPGARNDGIGLYAVVPRHRSSGQWVNFRVFVQFVNVKPPLGSLANLSKYGCWPDRTVVFQCTGQNCATFPGARM